jgi:hypothetical protein
MRRFALAILASLLFGCTRTDDESAKTIASLKSALEAKEKELAEAKAALKAIQDAQLDRRNDPEQRAADWVLANGGELMLRVGERPVDVQTVGQLPTEHFHILQILLKSNRKIDDAGVAALRGLSHIRNLDLFDTKIGDAGLRSILDLKTLEGLTLRETLVTDSGARELQNLTNLKLLDLVGTNVSPVTVEALRRSLPKCQIDAGEKK